MGLAELITRSSCRPRYAGLLVGDPPRLVRRLPQIPGRDRAIRPPAPAIGGERLRCGPGAAPGRDAEALAHAEVVHRQAVEPPGRAEGQHFDGPRPPAGD